MIRLPNGWAECVLGDFIFLKNGFAFKSTAYTQKNTSTLPVIRISDIDGKYSNDTNAVHIEAKDIESGFEIKKGDLLIAMSGATTGKCGIYIGNEPAYQNQRVGNLKFINSSFGNEKYRNYLILSLSTKILQTAYGGAQPNISGGSIENLNIALAPLPEQKRIADKLDATLARVDACRERLARVAPILKRFRQSVLAAAVSGRLTADWRAQQAGGDNIPLTTESPDQPAVIEPASGNQAQTRSPDAAQRNPGNNAASPSDINPDSGATTPSSGLAKTALPRSWHHVTFAEVCREITVGYVGKMSDQYKETGVPFLRSMNVRAFRFDSKGLLFISPEFHKAIAKSVLRPGDLAIVRSGAPGICCVIPETLVEANCSDLVIARPSSDLLAKYGCIFMNSTFAEDFVKANQVGVAQSHFNVGSMKATPIPLPPIAEQHEIVRRVESAKLRST